MYIAIFCINTMDIKHDTWPTDWTMGPVYRSEMFPSTFLKFTAFLHPQQVLNFVPYGNTAT